jgi:hypothetical protein
LIERCFVPAWIDQEKYGAFFDHLSGLEAYFLNMACDPRTNFHGFHCFSAASELRPFF